MAAGTRQRAHDASCRRVLQLDLCSLDRLSGLVGHHTGEATRRYALRVQRRNDASRKRANRGDGDKQESLHEISRRGQLEVRSLPTSYGRSRQVGKRTA